MTAEKTNTNQRELERPTKSNTAEKYKPKTAEKTNTNQRQSKRKTRTKDSRIIKAQTLHCNSPECF